MVELEKLITEYIEVSKKNELLKRDLSQGIGIQSALRQLIDAMGGEDKLQYAIQSGSHQTASHLPGEVQSGTMTDLVKNIVRTINGNFTISDVIAKVAECGREIDRPTTNIILWKLANQELIQVVERGKKGTQGTYKNKAL